MSTLLPSGFNVDHYWQMLLHGDLDGINLLVQPYDGHWRVTGLVDWGDVKLGPVAHEFISPGVHSYCGERALLIAWYEGYGLMAERRTAALQHAIMASTMLYYADEFAHFLNVVPGARHCSRWVDVAECFWHMGASGVIVRSIKQRRQSDETNHGNTAA